MLPEFFIGLDLGQAQDYTALVVIERPAKPDGWLGMERYHLRHLQRFQLGTSYMTIVPAVNRIVTTLARTGDTALIVDHTGVGRAVVDAFRESTVLGNLVPVTITSGHAVTQAEDGSYHVPKKDLITCLQMLFERQKLVIAQSLKDAEVLIRELSTFRVKITASANETFGAWRENDHDDLVLATALACWWAERCPRWLGDEISSGGVANSFIKPPPGTFVS